MLSARVAWIGVVVGAAALGACAANRSALSQLPYEASVRYDASTRLLVAALEECRTADAAGDETWVRKHQCDLVVEELRVRRNRREYEVYASAERMGALTSSCAAAAGGITVARSLHGPLAAADGAILPPTTELRRDGPSRERWIPPSEGETAMLDHARALVRCGDGASLGILLSMKDGLAQDLLRDDRSAVLAMVDAGKAPATLVAMAERLPERRPCPTSADEVVALMHGVSEIDRIHGCSCTDELPAEDRAVAQQERKRLAASDPHSVTTTTSPPRSSSSPDLANAPAGVGLVVMLPAALEALRSTGKSTTRYPVREACAASPTIGRR